MKASEWVDVLSLVDGIKNEFVEEFKSSGSLNLSDECEFIEFIDALSSSKHSSYFMNIELTKIKSAYNKYENKLVEGE